MSIEFLTRYRDTAELNAKNGALWIGELIDAHGLPLELVHMVGDQVSQIDVFDYTEGLEPPLVWQSRYWLDVFDSPRAFPHVECTAVLACLPDGSWQTVAEK